ncbi:MAG: iron-containing alcohol dehydrogenase [Planctomycetaceae bacterium]
MISAPPLADFQLAFPGLVRFGWGVRHQLPQVAKSLGRRAWLVVGSRTLMQSGLVDELRSGLQQLGIGADVLTTHSREPLVVDVDSTVARLRSVASPSGDMIIALGGGAAIDLAKATAALATNRQGESVCDYLEGVGLGLKIEVPPLPLIAIPTTAGTGSEATRNAVISSLDPPFKKSLRSEQMVPRAVILDPELTVSCPPHVTANSGMDAITQLIESLISRRANPFTAALCREGLQRALPALPRAAADGSDRQAREAMQYAAFLSGVALANSGLGLAHGVAAALGVLADIPHGLACAVMLPAAMRFNRNVRLHELAAVGRIFDPSLSDDEAAADAAVAGIEALNHQLGIPASLSSLGVRPERLDALVPASRGNSLSGNPRDVMPEDLTTLLHAMLS